MAHKFKVVYVAGMPRAMFEGDNEEAWVLGCYLGEATSFLSVMLDAVESVSTAEQHPVQFAGNEIFLDLYPDRAVIAAQWIKDQDGNECQITIPLDEAEELLIKWQAVLAEHDQQKE